jgi:hypothetical protein
MTNNRAVKKRAIENYSIPLEEDEQELLFEWAGLMEKRWPVLQKMYHIPNGGHRHKAVAAKLKAQGVKSGVPDICLPTARQGYHGLYIEMKRRKGNRATDSQTEWIKSLSQEGYKAVVCYGFDEARNVIEDYLSKGA